MPKTPGLVCVFALLAARGLNAECTPWAIAIGVSVYSDHSFNPNPVRHGKIDAETFADWFKRRAVCGSGEASAKPVIEILTDDNATRTAIRHTLEDVFQRASGSDEVFIFISARGIKAPTYGNDGYLIGTDGLKGRLYSSGIPIEDLSGLIPQRNVGKVFLFADLSRDLPGENRIVSQLTSQLAGNPAVVGLLSAKPGQTSLDTDQYPQGLFTYFLMKELQSGQPGKIAVSELYQNLLRDIRASHASQEPVLFGNSKGAVASINGDRPYSRVERVLIASLAPPPGSAFEEQDPVPPRPGSEVLDRLAEAARFEQQAQEILLRYGEGNQFPDDPIRPGKGDFETAAANYDRALATRPTLSNASFETRLRDSLRARMLFCRGRALMYDRRYDEALPWLRDAQSADRLLPEPANALGIVFLEQVQLDPGNYEKAIDAFRESIRLAPAWAYPRHNLALTLAEKGDSSGAEAVYREAIRVAPAQPYLDFNLGILLARLNRRHDAEVALRQSVGKFNDQEGSYRRQAALLTGPAAATALQRAETVRLNQAEAHNALGALLQGKKAETEYNLALALNSRLYAAEFNLGIVAMRGHKYSDAIKKFETLLQESPDFPGAVVKLDCANKADEYDRTRDADRRRRLRRELKGCLVR